MIRLYDFDEVRPEEILNRDIRAEADWCAGTVRC